MSCNKVIHEELSKEFELCPFCYKQISSRKKMKTVIVCCDNQDIINYEEVVCKNCGVIV